MAASIFGSSWSRKVCQKVWMSSDMVLMSVSGPMDSETVLFIRQTHRASGVGCWPVKPSISWWLRALKTARWILWSPGPRWR